MGCTAALCGMENAHRTGLAAFQGPNAKQRALNVCVSAAPLEGMLRKTRRLPANTARVVCYGRRTGTGSQAADACPASKHRTLVL